MSVVARLALASLALLCFLRSPLGAQELSGRLEGIRLNDVSPSQVAAIEVYPQGELASAQYSVRGACGVVVVWTKQSRRTGTASDAKKSRAPR